jgi:flagellar capping protein FliD
MGIDFSGTNNQLQIKDSTKLDSVLQSNSADVSKFFSDSGAGFSKRLDTVLTNQTGPSGSIATAVNSNNKRSASITSQIADMQRRLDQQRTMLEAEFTQMEQMQSTLQSQMTQLTNAFGGGSSSSSSSKSS